MIEIFSQKSEYFSFVFFYEENHSIVLLNPGLLDWYFASFILLRILEWNVLGSNDVTFLEPVCWGFFVLQFLHFIYLKRKNFLICKLRATQAKVQFL